LATVGQTAALGGIGDRVGAQVSNGYAGGSLSVGFQSQFSVSPALNRWFFGSAFGLEARAHVLRSLAAGSDAWLLAAGLALPLYVTSPASPV
jgi:hypothetical protein